MGKNNNAMKQQVYSLPDLIREQYKDLEPKTRKLFTTPEIFSFKKIILTGCGDSLAAGMAVKHLFEKLAKIPVEVVNTIDLSRAYNPEFYNSSPNNPLVIAISHSGAVARVGEAVERLNKYGALTLGITSNPDSYLGRQVDRNLLVDIPKYPSSPGVRSYLVSLVSLSLLAIRFGEANGTITQDQAKQHRTLLKEQADIIEEKLPELEKEINGISKQWKDFEAFDFIASGSDFASAYYGHAKIFEAFGKYAMYVNTEEFLHLNFFMRNTHKIGTIIFAYSDNPALSRTMEVIEYLHELGRPTMIISDYELKNKRSNMHNLVMPSSTFKSLTQFIPIALLAGEITELIGEEYGRGNNDQWTFSRGAKAVRESKIEVLRQEE